MREQELTRFMLSRNAFLLMLFVSVAATIIAFCAGEILYMSGNDGFGLPSFNEWVIDKTISLGISIALNLLMAFLLVYINRRFNLLRDDSPLFAGLFLVIQAAQPSVMGQLYDGTVECLLILAAIIPLFASFQRPGRTRSIFLIFFLMSLGSLTDYSYVAYIVAFIVGCAQMQCMSLRGVLAIIFGLVTPLWMAWGFGIINPSEFKMPVFVSIFDAVGRHEAIRMIVYAGVTLFIGLIVGGWNLLRIYSYNARARAYNGFCILLSVVTVVLLVIDYYHLMIYLPLLNCCTVVQIGHFFAINKFKRAYFPILCLLLIYSGLYIWGMMA